MKLRPIDFARRRTIPSACSIALVLGCMCGAGCASRNLARNDLSIYRATNDQAGHEFAKTEQFLVPVGSAVSISGLEFAPGVSNLTEKQKLIVQQVFNCLEEITENTVNDANAARVAEFKKMRFEIRGYVDDSGASELNSKLGEERAKAVMDWLTYLGTPSWRLKATGIETNSHTSARAPGKKSGRVDFIRLE